MTQVKRGFTLIELLVVIAIIAILAAILFPVFAQAKAAAKASAALSDSKQLDLAAIMYQNDYDDAFPVGTLWEMAGNDFQYGFPDRQVYFSAWSWQVAPYIKSAGLFLDPTAPPNPNPPAGEPVINWDAFHTQFGYNYTFLSPYVGVAGSIYPTSQNSSAGADLSDTVMITSKWTYADNTSNSASQVWGTGFPWFWQGALSGAQGNLLDVGSEPPVCSFSNYNCMTDWGAGGFFDDPNANEDQKPYPSIVDGRLTGGNAYRVADKVTVGFCDGHAKNIGYGAVAAGTDFNINAPAGAVGAAGGIDVLHDASYLWSLTKSCGTDYQPVSNPVSGLPVCSQ